MWRCQAEIFLRPVSRHPQPPHPPTDRSTCLDSRVFSPCLLVGNWRETPFEGTLLRWDSRQWWLLIWRHVVELLLKYRPAWVGGVILLALYSWWTQSAGFYLYRIIATNYFAFNGTSHSEMSIYLRLHYWAIVSVLIRLGSKPTLPGLSTYIISNDGVSCTPWELWRRMTSKVSWKIRDSLRPKADQ
jgi:hypothetical protein